MVFTYQIKANNSTHFKYQYIQNYSLAVGETQPTWSFLGVFPTIGLDKIAKLLNEHLHCCRRMGSFFQPACYLEHLFHCYSCSRKNVNVIPVLSTQAPKCSVTWQNCTVSKDLFFCLRNLWGIRSANVLIVWAFLTIFSYSCLVLADRQQKGEKPQKCVLTNYFLKYTVRKVKMQNGKYSCV